MSFLKNMVLVIVCAQCIVAPAVIAKAKKNEKAVDVRTRVYNAIFNKKTAAGIGIIGVIALAVYGYKKYVNISNSDTITAESLLNDQILDALYGQQFLTEEGIAEQALFDLASNDYFNSVSASKVTAHAILERLFGENQAEILV